MVLCVSYDVLPVNPVDLPELLRAPIEAARDEADELRKLPAKLLEELRDSGVFRLSTPRELGGFELPLGAVLRILEELGRIDGPVAWTVWNANLGITAAVVPASGVGKIWADGPDPILVSSSRPVATARPVDGGFVVDGRWDIVSGVDSADWACLFALVFDGDGPAVTEDGHPDLRLFCVPREDYTIEDTWDVTAMRGTGSNTVVLDKVFVPSDLTGTLSGPPTIDRPLYRIPPFSVVGSGCAAVVLGMAQAALDEIVRLAPTKTTPEGSSVAERFHVQACIGRVDAELRAARLLFQCAAADLDRTAAAGESATVAQRGLLREAMSLANKVSRGALVDIQELASSSALYQHHRLEHIIRDGLAATQHGNLASTNFALAGRIHLGLDPQSVIF
jgi:indole-3-acetate monooxygenase